MENYGNTQIIPTPNTSVNHNQLLHLQPQPADNLKHVSDEEYFNAMPPGFRFRPKDDELIRDYLLKMVNNEPMPRMKNIHKANLYEFDPDTLSHIYKKNNETELYFFTPREKKYKNGTRPKRSAGYGYWKATGADKSIKHGGQTIGVKKALVYYTGKPPSGVKTSWMMHEYRVVHQRAPTQTPRNDMMLDKCVLCKIYKKTPKSNRNQEANHEGDANHQEVNEEAVEIPLSVEQVSSEETLVGTANVSPSDQGTNMEVSFPIGAVQPMIHPDPGLINASCNQATSFGYPSMFFPTPGVELSQEVCLGTEKDEFSDSEWINHGI